MPGPSQSHLPSSAFHSTSHSTFPSSPSPSFRSALASLRCSSRGRLSPQDSSRLQPRSVSRAPLRDRSMLVETPRRHPTRGSSPCETLKPSSSCSSPSSLLKTSHSSLLSFSTSRRLANFSPSSSSSSSQDRSRRLRASRTSKRNAVPRRLSSPSPSSSSSRSPSASASSSRGSRSSKSFASPQRRDKSRRQPPLLQEPTSPQSQISSLRQATYEKKVRRFQAKLRAADLLLSPPPSPSAPPSAPALSPRSSSASARTRASATRLRETETKREEAPSLASTCTPASSHSTNASGPKLPPLVPSLRELYSRAHRAAQEAETASSATRQGPESRESRLVSSFLRSPRQSSSLSSRAALPSGCRGRVGKASDAMTGNASDEALDVRVKNVEEKAAQIKFAFKTRTKLQRQELNSLADQIDALRIRQDMPVAGFLGNAGMAERLVKDELQANKHARLAFAAQCTSDADCMLQGVRDLHRKACEKAGARRGAEAGVQEIEASVQGCREVLQALGDSRNSLESSLRRLLSEAFQGVEETISQERRICHDAEASMSRMLAELRQQARGDIRASRETREQVEEQILQLLEDACVKVETSVLTSGNLPRASPS